MSWYAKLRMVPKIVLPVGFLMILALGLLTWQIQFRSTRVINTLAEKELIALAGSYGSEVQAFVEVALDASITLRDSVGNMLAEKIPVTRDQLIAMHWGIQKENPNLIASGSIWEPNSFDAQDDAFRNTPGSDRQGRFIPYAPEGSKEITTVEGYENSDYYTVPKQTKKPFVSEPYLYTVSGRKILMSTTAAPLVINNTHRGISFTDISLDDLNSVVDKIKLYESGYGGLVTQKGVIVAHPNRQFIGKSLFDMNRSVNPEKLKQAMRNGQPFFENRTIDGRQEICYYHPIAFRETGQHWYFVITAPLNEVMQEATSLSIMTVGMSAATLVLVLLAILLIVRSCSKPIIYLAEIAEKISHGDLKVVIQDANFGGEVGMLSQSMKEMISSLVENISKAEVMSEDARQQAANAQQSMKDAERASLDAEAKRDSMLRAADKLEEVASIVSSASSELSAQIEQSERGASEQAARVTETATAMEEMNSTVLEVAKNAATASEVSATTRKKAEEGASVVEKAVQGIRSVQEQSLTLKEDMLALSHQAQSISQIMGVISDIADQTNLLALNAAIEAARAGEAGRGFAVVADEVRKLAEKTMASTTDVGNAIRSIQQCADKSMAQVDSTVKTIEETTEMANQSGKALSQIVSLVDNTADQVHAIATASEEQSASSEEITQSIGQVNTIAGETARAMEEAARAVSDLAEQAQVLAGLIDDMKRG